MSLSTIIREALQALVRNRVRSLLTMLGIIMGVGSFICVVAVGNAGSQDAATIHGTQKPVEIMRRPITRSLSRRCCGAC